MAEQPADKCENPPHRIAEEFARAAIRESVLLPITAAIAVPFQIGPPVLPTDPPMRINPPMLRCTRVFTARLVVTFNFRGRRAANPVSPRYLRPPCYNNNSSRGPTRSTAESSRSCADSVSVSLGLRALHYFPRFFPPSYINTERTLSGRLLLRFQLFPRSPCIFSAPPPPPPLVFYARGSRTKISPSLTRRKKRTTANARNSCRLFSLPPSPLPSLRTCPRY